MFNKSIYKIKNYILSCFNYRKVFIKGFKQHSSSKIPLFQIEVWHQNFQKTSYTLSAKKIKNNPLLFNRLTLEEKIEVAYFAGVQDILEENLEISILRRQNSPKTLAN